jgi:hypothetical protein
VHYKDAWSLKLSTSGLSRSTLPIRAGLDTLPPVCRSSTRRLVTRLIFQFWKLVPIDGPLSAWMSAYEQPWALGLPTQAGSTSPHSPAGGRGDLYGRPSHRRGLTASWRDVSFLANQYSIRRSSCATTLIWTIKQQHHDLGLAAAEEPIDEEMLADVVATVGRDRGRHWMSGCRTTNALHASLPSQAFSFVLRAQQRRWLVMLEVDSTSLSPLTLKKRIQELGRADGA